MAIKEITHVDYNRILCQLEGLSPDEAGALRNQLAAKYYAYLDRAIQCKKAVSEYEQVAGQIRSLKK